MYIHIHAHIHTHIYHVIQVHTHILHTHPFEHMDMYVWTCMNYITYILICTHAHTHKHIHTHVHTHIHTHIHTRTYTHLSHTQDTHMSHACLHYEVIIQTVQTCRNIIGIHHGILIWQFDDHRTNCQISILNFLDRYCSHVLLFCKVKTVIFK